MVKHELARRIAALKAGKPVTFTRRVMNITGAGARVVGSIFGNQPIMVSAEEQTRRMAICGECEFFNGHTCRKCGCHIRFKAKLQTEHCPIGKW